MPMRVRVPSSAPPESVFHFRYNLSDSPVAVRGEGERGPLGPPEQKEQL